MDRKDKIKQRLLRQYDRIIAPIEKRFKNKVTKVLDEQADKLAARFRRYVNEKKADNQMSEEEAIKEAERIANKIFKEDEGIQLSMFLPLWLNAGKLGNDFFNQIHFADEDGTLFAIIRDEYLQWLDNYGAEQVVNINNTTKELTKQIIKEGLINGESYDTIADNLSSKIKEYTKARALNIAVTESHNTFQRANFMTADKSGFKYKRWLSSRDEVVRPNHRNYDALGFVPIDYMYASGLEFPGDSRAAASETVRCRCVIRYAMSKEG